MCEPNVVANLTKIRLAVADNPAGCTSETVWAESLGNHRYRLLNIPLFSDGFSIEDILLADDTNDGMPQVTGLAERGGWSTYRIDLNDAASRERLNVLLEPFKRLGCRYEVGCSRLVGISVEPGSNIHAVWDVLEKGEQDGIWAFDEGHCSHVLVDQTHAE